MPHDPLLFRPARSVWPLVIFLLGFVALVWLVSNRFLLPAMVAAQDATTEQKRQLMAYSRLLLAIVLFVLCVGMLMIFRVRRFFFPRSLPSRQKTEYIDAWAEAGRRLNSSTDPNSESENP